MAVGITYNSDILSLFQTFYTARQVSLLESLAWLEADEKSMGVSKEQNTLIIHLAHFCFIVIGAMRVIENPDWTYLDWLTQEEYDAIIYKRDLL